MPKRLFIAEKPSVARDYAAVLEESFTGHDGYLESENSIVTWCYGHLVTLSFPDAYDKKYRKWSLDTIPFIPEAYRYQVIDGKHTQKQFRVVKRLLTAREVETIYICTDSGREGEYIYRLVAGQAGVQGKRQLRVWINSFTEGEIRRGIREAKDDSAYDNMGAAAYLRAQEDYLMGINFSRALTLKYAEGIRRFLGMDRCVIAVGRVMTCVLGMIVQREREIRSFVRTPFYRVTGTFGPEGADTAGEDRIGAEWTAVEGSRYLNSPLLYRENGFRKREDAQTLVQLLERAAGKGAGKCPVVREISHKREKKNAPLLYNLAELQNDCSRLLKLRPEQTLNAAQALYERKLTTYPRTDARVLSTAVAAEIERPLKGLGKLPAYRELVRTIARSGTWKTIGNTRYTNDKAITDHYAIIPTGEGTDRLRLLDPALLKVYDLIVRRFLSIFYPAAVFRKISLCIGVPVDEQAEECFLSSVRVNEEQGYLICLERGGETDADDPGQDGKRGTEPVGAGFSSERAGDAGCGGASTARFLQRLKKGDVLSLQGLSIKEGETTPPKRYTGGSMILAMENAGQLIEEEELREQIRGSGIGTSATRSGILEKLVKDRYIRLNAKTQIYRPTQLGEMIYDTVAVSLRPLLEPKLTASWEMGLTQVAGGKVSPEEYRAKLNDYVTRRTNAVKNSDYRALLREMYRQSAPFYPGKKQSDKPAVPEVSERSHHGNSGPDD